MSCMPLRRQTNEKTLDPTLVVACALCGCSQAPKPDPFAQDRINVNKSIPTTFTPVPDRPNPTNLLGDKK
jgi:hypothetical protein